MEFCIVGAFTDSFARLARLARWGNADRWRNPPLA